MRAVILSGLVSLAPTLAAAQQTTGAVEGRVVDASQSAVVDVQITATGAGLLGARLVVSDEHGRFRLLALPPGTVALEFVRIGYRPLVVEGIDVRPGQTTAVAEVTLAESAAQLPALVVTADRASIDPRSTAISSDLAATVFESLPVGRDYASLLTLLPQANESYYADGVNVAGGTGLENAYFVDGVNVTEPYRGAGGIDLPHNFIEHVQLLRGGYEAEYGRALGGLVNVVTRSGGNDTRLSAFGFFTGSDLASSPERGLLDRREGDFTRYDVGLSLGGPIQRDRLWYFAAYDARVERQRVGIPGSAASESDENLGHQFAAKLTWRPTAATDLVLTAVGDPSERDIVGNPFFATLVPADSLANPDPVLGVWNEGGVLVGLDARRRIGDLLLLEATASRATSWQKNGPRTERGLSEPLVTDAEASMWSGGYGNFWDRKSARTAASLRATLHAGAHSMEAGIQFEENRLDEEWRWLANGPDNAGWIARYSDTEYYTFPLDVGGRVRNRVYSAFIQGSWEPTPWLRLNPGVRWDGQFFSGPGGRNGAIPDQLQPRLGFVIDPGGAAGQKISGSLGRFYEQVPTHPVSFWWGGYVQDLFIYDHDPRVDPTGGSLLRSVYGAADELTGQHYDEATLGYERSLGGGRVLRARAVYRTLREILTTADSLLVDDSSTALIAANPGREPAGFLPRPRSSYAALELSAQRWGDGPLGYLVSYVLSRHHGNYVGLYDQDAGIGNPHGGSNFMNPAEQRNGAGLLPNDRTHVLKGLTSYRFRTRLTLGAQLTLQSGTPLNYWGTDATYAWDVSFLLPRGTAGRTPWLYDIGLHASYDLRPPGGRGSAKLVLDVFHLFSPKRAVLTEQRAFLDPALTQPNPLYGQVLLRQPPMTLRIGAQLGL